MKRMKHNLQSAHHEPPAATSFELETRKVYSVSKEEQLVVLAAHGTEILKGMLVVSDKYYNLCVYVRTRNVEHAVVRDALEPLGFRKERISEIHRVATSSDALWSEFAARNLSFRRTLELTRGTVELLLTDSEKESSAWVKDIPEASDIKADAVRAEEKQQRLTPSDKLELLVHQIAFQAEKMSVRGKTFVCENGWSVKVFRTKKGGAK